MSKFKPTVWADQTVQSMIRMRQTKKWLLDTVVDLTGRATSMRADSIEIPTLTPFDAQVVATGAAASDPGDTTKGSKTLTINKQIEYPFYVYDIDVAQQNVSEMAEQTEIAADATRIASNLQIMKLLINGVTTSAPDHLVPIEDTSTVKFTEADIKAAKVAFDTAKVPLGDRFCVVNPKYADDLTSITNFVSVDKVPQQPGAIYYGYVGQAHGIQFIMMDNCPLVDDDGTISATAGNNTNKCAIFYHRLAAAAAMQKRFSQKIQPHALATKDLINIWSGWGEVVLNSNFIYVKYDPTDNDA